MADINKKKGVKGAKDDANFERNMSRTCEAVHQLCEEYLDDKYLKWREKVDKLEMYCTKQEVIKQSGECGVAEPVHTNTRIEKEEGFKCYFGHVDGTEREWRVVRERPSFNYKGTILYVRCWFPSFETTVLVDVVAASKYCNNFEKVCLLCYVECNLAAVRDLDKTKKLRKWAEMAGDDESLRTRVQKARRKELQLNETHRFTQGLLYPDRMTPEYAPDQLLQANQVVAPNQLTNEETMVNDCLTRSVNQAVRHELFISREQVQRLWMVSGKFSKEYVDYRKVEFGVSIKAFKEFFV